VISEQAIQQESRHAVFANRYAGGLHRDFLPILEQIYAGVKARIIDDYSTDIGRRKLNALIRDLEAYQRELYQPWLAGFVDEMQEFAISEGEFELESLKSVAVGDVDFTLPANTQMVAALMKDPLIFPDSNKVVLLQPFLDGYKTSQINRLSNIVRTGFATGATVDQMAKAIQQTTKQSRQANRAIIRTAVNHASATARTLTMEENDDVVIGYQWLSTLDDRTSAPCRSLDGKVFKWSDDYKPKPPIHVACRSTTVPQLADEFVDPDDDAKRGAAGSSGRGQVDATTSYYQFLKNQSREFQIDVLGKDRAKLFRDGGLNAKEFAALTVDEKFRPLTLAEMRERNQIVFERANVNVPRG